MAPFELEKMMMAELRKIFLKMTSPRWDLALLGKSEEEVTEAALSLLAVQRTRLRLENKELAELRDGLIANEAELIAGRDAVDEALTDLSNVKGVLEAVTGFLKTIGKIIAIVM
jgi:hypothetical protein